MNPNSSSVVLPYLLLGASVSKNPAYTAGRTSAPVISFPSHRPRRTGPASTNIPIKAGAKIENRKSNFKIKRKIFLKIFIIPTINCISIFSLIQ